MGCLEEEMPPECKQFVRDLHTLNYATDKLLFGLPFHKLWRTKDWKDLVQSQKGMLEFANKLISQKIREIKKEGTESSKAELGTDFLTYMINSGSLSAEEIAVNAVDLLEAGIDTVSETL